MFFTILAILAETRLHESTKKKTHKKTSRGVPTFRSEGVKHDVFEGVPAKNDRLFA